MNNYCVYYHKSPSGKMYIGRTNNYKSRCYKHKNTKGCIVFKNAIDKYGWDNFEHKIVLDNLSFDEANELEEFLIEECNTLTPNGYNIRSGGLTQKIPCGLSIETKQKISKALKGRVPYNKGMKLPEEVKKNMRGRIPHNKGVKKLTPSTYGQQVLINGILYPSIQNAADKLCLTYSCLYNRFRRRQTGYEYLNNINNLEKE